MTTATLEQEVDPWAKRLLVRASAGSGKTHQLSTRLLGSLLGGAPLESILAVTFTRKAAGEIRDRVFVRLAKACLKPDELAKLRNDFVGSPLINANKLLTPNKMSLRLRELVQNQHRLSISTLDSFFSVLARAFGFELNLPSGWRLCDPYETNLMRYQAIRATIESLTTTQLQSLIYMLSKDELRTNLMQELDRTTKDGYAVFQNSSAEAWDEPHVPSGPHDEAVQAAIQRLEHCDFRTKQAEAKFRELAVMAIQGAWIEMSETTLAGNLYSGKLKFGNTILDDEQLNAASNVLISRAKTMLLAQIRSQTQATREILEKYETHLAEIKHQRRLLTFDDLVEGLGKFLAQQQDSAGGLATRLQGRLDAQIQHILLDEFQDTSPSQWRVIEPFLRTAISMDGSLFCVGDTKQAIYGWRGGQAALFEALTERVHGLQSTTLAKSYRSSPVIMDTVNRCFRRLDNHPELKSSEPAALRFMESFPEHCTARHDLPGHVVLETAPQAIEGDETSPSLIRAVEIVERWRLTRPQCQVGVLTRDNRSIGIVISLLRERGIEASQEGGNPLIDSPAVELVLSVLQLADHSANPIPAFHLQGSPLTELLKLPTGPFDTQENKEIFQLAVRCAGHALRLRLATFGLGATVSWLASALTVSVPARDRIRLAQLVELGHRFGRSFRLRADDFIEFVQEERVAVPTDRPVSVMTIHKAKGLEFDAVVLPELKSELIGRPDLLMTISDDIMSPPVAVMRSCSQQKRAFLSDSWNQCYERWEADRTTGALCVGYVAMTRPRQALHIIVPAFSANPPKDKCLDALITAALQDDDTDATMPGTILYERGDPDWLMAATDNWRDTEIVDTDSTNERAEQQLTLISEFIRADQLEAERPQSIQLKPRALTVASASPSRLAELGTHPFELIFDPRRRTGEAIGTLLHLWLADIEWLDHRVPTEKDLQRLAFKLPGHLLRYLDIRYWADRFQELLSNESIGGLFKLGRYQSDSDGNEALVLSVRRESTVTAILDGRRVSGRIDRMVVVSSGGRPIRAEIIDFKSDSDDERQTPEAIQEKYRGQLELYRRILSRQLQVPLTNISCTLVVLSRPAVFTW